MLSEPSVIAFFETRAQLEALLYYQQQSGDKLELVAMTPEADYAAEQAGLKYRVIEEFYLESELIERGVQNFEIVQLFCDQYDMLLHSVFANFPNIEWVSSHYYLHALKGILDSLLHRSVPVLAVFDTLRPTRVICFYLPPPNERETFHLLSRPVLMLTSRLVPLVAQAAGCQITWLPMTRVNTSSDVGSKVGFRESLKELARQTPLWSWLRWGKRTLTGLVSCPYPRKVPMLIYGAGLDDAEAVRTYWHEHLEGQVLSLGEVFPDVTPSVAYTHTAEQLWEKVRHEAKLRGYFAIQGLDLFSIIEADVRLLTLDLMPQLVALAERAPRALVDVHGGVILMGGTQGKHRVIAKAAHAAGVPVVTMHYGGPYGYTDCPMTEYYDLADVDYFLCYGEGTARYLEQPSPAAYVRPGSRRAKLVAVGSPALDKVVARQRQCAGKTVDNDKLAYGEQELLAATTERAREVMYVIGAMIGDLRYFSYNLCPDIWYWRLHREVVKTCICFPNVRLIVKPPLKGRIPEVPNPLSEWILKNGVRNCELLHDVPFEEVLHLADAYITDCPSTVLLQAMTTMKPVIVYLDRTLYRLDRHAMTLLRKRATVSETREEFLQDIADFLHRPDWTLPRPVNDEFLCAYGTYLNDGRSAERAAQLLMDLAKQ